MWLDAPPLVARGQGDKGRYGQSPSKHTADYLTQRRGGAKSRPKTFASFAPLREALFREVIVLVCRLLRFAASEGLIA